MKLLLISLTLLGLALAKPNTKVSSTHSIILTILIAPLDTKLGRDYPGQF